MRPITNKNYADTTFTVEFPLFSQIKLFSGFISVIHWIIGYGSKFGNHRSSFDQLRNCCCVSSNCNLDED